VNECLVGRVAIGTYKPMVWDWSKCKTGMNMAEWSGIWGREISRPLGVCDVLRMYLVVESICEIGGTARIDPTVDLGIEVKIGVEWATRLLETLAQS
jgi:hypothetical protein